MEGNNQLRKVNVGGLVRFLVGLFLFLTVAVILFPAINVKPRHSNVAKARKEMSDIKLAVESFQSQYGRWPITVAVMNAANPDFTFGTYETGGEQRTEVLSNSKRRYQANNSEAVVILMSEVHPKFNPNYTNNPQKKVFLNPARDNREDGKPGVGPSRLWLDPWGNPYIISLDVDGDGAVSDAFYSLAKVSRGQGPGVGGLNGLFSKSGMGTNDYALHGTVMIWSFGPDGKADPNIRADEGVNRDNILSWK